MKDTIHRQDKPGPSNKLVYLVLFSLMLIHAYCAVSTFEHPSELFKDISILNDDYPAHYYQMKSERMGYRGSHLWGYEPNFMAGLPLFPYTAGVLWILLGKIMFFINTGAAHKTGLLLMIFPVPLLFYLTGRYTGLRNDYSAIGAIFGTVIYWTGVASYGNWTGMSEAVIAALLCIAAISALIKCLSSETGKGHVITLFVCVSLAGIAHPTSVVILSVPLGTAFLFLSKQAGIKRVIRTGFVLALALVINLWWIYPLWILRHYMAPVSDVTILFYSSNLNFWEQIIKDLLGFWQEGAGTILAMDTAIIMAIVGIFSLRSREGSGKAYVWASGIIFLALITYLGPSIESLRPLQPRRYLLAFSFMLVPPAAWGVYALCTSVKNRFGKVGQVTAYLLLIIIAVCSFRLENYSDLFSIFPLKTRFNPEVSELLSYMQNNLKGEGRLMVEDSSFQGPDGMSHVFGGSHVPALIPHILNREVIGGPHPGFMVINRFASLQDGKLGNKLISTYSREELASYMDLYNIKWALAWSGYAKKTFDTYPELFEKQHDVGRFSIYRLLRESSFIMGATANVKADYNRIEVKGLKQSEGPVILKYHWLEFFQSEPDVAIKPVKILDDPVPFIEVTKPVENFIIFNSY